MDELTKGIQDPLRWFMLGRDIAQGQDIAQRRASVGLNTKLELWRDTLESKGFRLSRTRTKDGNGAVLVIR